MSMLHRVSILVLFGLLFLSFNACNTIRGFGKDVQKAGETIEDVAK